MTLSDPLWLIAAFAFVGVYAVLAALRLAVMWKSAKQTQASQDAAARYREEQRTQTKERLAWADQSKARTDQLNAMTAETQARTERYLARSEENQARWEGALTRLEALIDKLEQRMGA